MVDAAEPLNRALILWVVCELAPEAQVGGLGDVARTLPPLLRDAGLDVRVCVPKHRAFKKKPAVEGHVYYIDRPELFDRDGVYGSADDDAYRFGVFAQEAVVLAKRLGATVLHALDWQTAFVPVIATVPTIFTVHNVAYQGVVDSGVIPALGLPWSVAGDDGLGFGWQKVNLLKGGVLAADLVTTVSETHAKDIQTPEGGFGLHAAFAARAAEGALHGIMNGIDTRLWDPGAVTPGWKLEHRRALAEQFALSDRPLLVSIGRLTEQKGIDVLIAAAREPSFSFDLFVLGTGDAALQTELQALAAERPDRVRVAIAFDEALSRRALLAGDFFVMPSRFEPAGLAQLQAQRFGAVPIVRRTGGLAESVIDMGDPGGNGICFADASVASLSHALGRARALWDDRSKYAALQSAAMAAKVDWRERVPKYLELYARAAG